MKKIVWIVAGLVVLVCAMLFVGRERAGEGISNVGQGTVKSEDGGLASDFTSPEKKNTAMEDVESAGSVSSIPKSRPSVKYVDSELSDPVKALLGLDGKVHNYPELLAAINDLGYELNPVDVAALMDMLDYPNDRFPEKMRPVEINAVKNDVLDLLLRQKRLPEGLGLHLVEMAGNAGNDPVWRDYCVQFMVPFYERVAGVGETTKDTKNTTATELNESGESVQSVDELLAIRDAMFRASDDRSGTLAGTALIGLENLSRTHDGFDRETIVAKVAEMASDEGASTASRMTALRLAVTMEDAGVRSVEVRNAARMLAQTGETVLLRSAAIVTLGEVGSADDRELLESYAGDENRQIASAAKMALKKMDTRNL